MVAKPPTPAPAPAPTATPVPSSKKLDAILRVLEKRAPGLRKAGVQRVTVGAVHADLEALPAAAPRKRPGDEDDEGPGYPPFDTKAAFRATDRRVTRRRGDDEEDR